MGSWVSIILKYLIGSRLVTRTGYDMYSFAKYENKSFYIKFLYLVLTQVTLIFSDAYTSTSKVDIKFIKKTFSLVGRRYILFQTGFVIKKRLIRLKEI